MDRGANLGEGIDTGEDIWRDICGGAGGTLPAEPVKNLCTLTD
jgi:hypothetical protein